MKRRTFLKSTTLVSVGATTGMFAPVSNGWAFVQSDAIQKFAMPLRRFGNRPEDIPIAQPDGTGAYGAQHYTLELSEFRDQIRPGGGTTRLWGFRDASSAQARKHLGGIIVAERGKPVQVTFRNRLPNSHIFPVDTTLPGAEGAANRVSVHLHGGNTPWISDGGPLAWFGADGSRGPDYQDLLPLLNRRSSPAGSAEYFYPNNQSARMMWYHDHAIGITRLNVYAGLASGYILTDSYEKDLVASRNLPAPIDPRTHYLIFQDKTFVPQNIDVVDPLWNLRVAGSRAGDLWYPHVYEPDRWAVGPATSPLPPISAVPEAFGDTILVNGTTYPVLTLEAKVHRLRMANACNARFLRPRLLYAQDGAPTEADTKRPGPGFTQIGNEGGFLPFPVPVNGSGLQLLLAPAERADLLLDLSNVPAGSTLILYNDAPAPFPGGDGRYDYYPGNPKTPTARPGVGPNTRTLLQIQVTQATTPGTFPNLPTAFAPTDPFLYPQSPGQPLPIPGGVPVRRLTLNESFDQYGRLIQFLGADVATNTGVRPAQYGLMFEDPPTEKISQGSTEVWEIYNLTADTHPIHFHLVNVQILNRQRFSSQTVGRGQSLAFNSASLNFLGAPVAPDANEMGWKEAVRVNPGEVTRVVMRFNLPVVPFTVPISKVTGGHSFVWHCHILEHEEHDMMRPLVIS